METVWGGKIRLGETRTSVGAGDKTGVQGQDEEGQPENLKRELLPFIFKRKNREAR